MKALRKWLVRLLLLAVLTVATTLVYLDVHGFPPALIRVVAAQFARAGYVFECRAMRLDWLRGVIASDMRLADAKAPAQTLARVDEVVLHISWRRLWHRQNAIAALRVANANLTVPTPPDEIGRQNFVARQAYARVQFEDDGSIRIDQLIGTYCGVNLNVKGRVRPRAASAATVTPPGAPPAAQGHFAMITKALRELYSLQANEAPQLDLDFDLDLARPLAGRVHARLLGSGVKYRQVATDSLAVVLDMREGAVQVSECRVLAGGGELSVTGRYDVAMGEFDLRLHSSIHPSVVAPALPDAAMRVLREVRVTGRPDITARYWLSPETGTRPKLAGHVDLPGLEYQGIVFKRIVADVEQLGPDIVVSRAQVVMAEGELTGRGRYHIESSDFAYEFTSTLNPLKLLPVMPPGIRGIVEPSWFKESPRLTAKVTGDFVDPERFAYDAELQTGPCRYRGVPLAATTSRWQLRRNQLAVRDVVLTRPDGKVRGEVDVDFVRNRVRFDAQTTADPLPLAPLLGPKAAEIMQPYRCGGRVLGAAQGVADFERPEQTAWRAEVTGKDFTFWQHHANEAHGVLTLSNNVLRIVADGRGVTGWGYEAGTMQATVEVTGATVQIQSRAGDVTGHSLRADAVQSFVTVTGPVLQATGEVTNVAWGQLKADALRGTVTVAGDTFRAVTDADGFAWWKLRTDRARADVSFTNQVLTVAGFEGDFHNGKLKGDATFAFTNALDFRLQLAVQDCDVERITQGMGRKSAKPITGTLGGQLELRGTGDGAHALQGQGKLVIRDGVLWEVPVFGIFSHLLGNTKATAAKADFTISDNKVRTENLEIAAGAFTAQSQGYVGLDGRLSFRVQAQFLKAWPGINILSAVLGKMLEYKVGGSLDDPKYLPLHVPKELLPHDTK